MNNRGWEASEEDERTVAQLFCDQLEFANVIIANKMDLLDVEGRHRLQTILGHLNPTAKIVETTWGQVDPKEVLGTCLFDLEKAEEHPKWLCEEREGEHVPETLEYGISSVVFRSRRPFKECRFKHLVEKWRGVKRMQLFSTDASSRAALNIVRLKGLVWLDNQKSHWQQGMASLAGSQFTITFGALWDAAFDGKGRAASATAQPNISQLEGPWGDRRTELVIIGQYMDSAAIMKALEECVATEEEMTDYNKAFREATSYFYSFDERQMPGISKAELTERIRRYKIEIQAPKEKETQVLKVTPKSTTVVSAHSVIGVFSASSDQSMGTFDVERYLKYAHLFPELASGLVKQLKLPLNSVDSQTAILAADTNDSLSVVVGQLNAGDKVELEWLQIRVEYDTDIDEDRYRIIEQCIKLHAVNTAAEVELVKQYPQPQIMIPKLQVTAEGSCGVLGTQVS